MKKVKLIIAAVAMLSLVSGSAVYADGFAPGEGLYIGAFGGGDVGIVQPKVVTAGAGTTNVVTVGVHRHTGGTFESTDGGLGLAGIVGGGLVGYGYKMGDLYAGLEGEMSAGDVKFKLTSSNPVELSGGGHGADNPGAEATHTVTSLEAKKEWTGGMFGRIGLYVNPDTLLAFKAGVLVSKFEVTLAGTPSFSEDYYGGGASFGASLESRLSSIDPNFSLRIGTVYTDFMTANVFSIGTKSGDNMTDRSGHNSEVTGSALSARIGIQYSFFDANSLF